MSEAFENLSGEPKLELEVLTLNINEGHNEELMEQCQTLREYAQYVNCVRKYAEELELNEAVKLAVDECIRNNILSEFLRANKSEVISMSIFEYDKEEEERKLRKAEYEAGVADGLNTAKKDAAIAFAELHVPIEQIALALKVDVEAVKNGFVKQVNKIDRWFPGRCKEWKCRVLKYCLQMNSIACANERIPRRARKSAFPGIVHFAHCCTFLNGHSF